MKSTSKRKTKQSKVSSKQSVTKVYQIGKTYEIEWTRSHALDGNPLIKPLPVKDYRQLLKPLKVTGVLEKIFGEAPNRVLLLKRKMGKMEMPELVKENHIVKSKKIK